MEKEKRTTVNAELRAEQDSNTISGYAALFESESDNLGGFKEVIKRGAFDGVLDVSDVRALYNHDPNQILARSSTGTLKLEVDDRGLKYSFTVPELSYAKDLAENIRNGNISQSSFAFTVEDDDWQQVENRGTVRTINKFKKIFDVSPVTYPAYSNTSTTIRSLEQHKDNQEKTKTPDPSKKVKRRRRRLALVCPVK